MGSFVINSLSPEYSNHHVTDIVLICIVLKKMFNFDSYFSKFFKCIGFDYMAYMNAPW